MFADTITVTVNAVDKVLVRVNQDAYSSEYRLMETDGNYRLRIRNTSYSDKTRKNVSVDRHNCEFVYTKYPVTLGDPPTVRKIYTVIENDQGDALTNSAKHSVGGLAFLTEANILKMLNFES